MDNMDYMIMSESVKFRDILRALGSMFSVSKESKNDEINKKLQKVYEIEKEIGATDAINSAENFLKEFASKTLGKKSPEMLSSVKTKVNRVNTKTVNNELSNDTIDIDEEKEI